MNLLTSSAQGTRVPALAVSRCGFRSGRVASTCWGRHGSSGSPTSSLQTRLRVRVGLGVLGGTAGTAEVAGAARAGRCGRGTWQLIHPSPSSQPSTTSPCLTEHGASQSKRLDERKATPPAELQGIVTRYRHKGRMPASPGAQQASSACRVRPCRHTIQCLFAQNTRPQNGRCVGKSFRYGSYLMRTSRTAAEAHFVAKRVWASRANCLGLGWDCVPAGHEWGMRMN